MIKEALEAVGLSDKETEVYLANLELGESLVQAIAKKSGLNRTSCYDVLRSLEHKGFVSYVIKSGKKYYQATHPAKIIGLIKEKEMLVKKALPELIQQRERVGKKPSIEVYTGKEGLKSIFEDILRENKDFICMASKTHLTNLFKYYFPHFVKRRIKQKIKVKLLTDAVPYDKKVNYKIINQKFKTATWIYGDKLAMVSLEEKEPIGILIQEKNFAETHSIIFKLIWNSVRK